MKEVIKKNLVILQKTERETIKDSFYRFASRYGVDVSKVIEELDLHGKYLTNGEYYFKYQARLNFMKAFRASETQLLKLKTFYKNFKNPYLWTITRKTFTLKNPIVDNIIYRRKNDYGEDLVIRKQRVKFEQIEQCDYDFKLLHQRLKRVGLLQKYILVPEIVDNEGKLNYHYHLLVDSANALSDTELQKLQEIVRGHWKEITHGSFIVDIEKVRSRLGALNYILSYMNKPMQYRDIDMIPYMYYALKSKKAYRLKGCKKLDDVKIELLDEKKRKISFKYIRVFVEKEEIPIPYQDYYKRVIWNSKIVYEVKIRELFISTDHSFKGNKLLNKFDKKLEKYKFYFKKEDNWKYIEEKFSDKEIQYLLNVGDIYATRDGYKLLE